MFQMNYKDKLHTNRVSRDRLSHSTAKINFIKNYYINSFYFKSLKSYMMMLIGY